jgi:hypothetical protein
MKSSNLTKTVTIFICLFFFASCTKEDTLKRASNHQTSAAIKVPIAQSSAQVSTTINPSYSGCGRLISLTSFSDGTRYSLYLPSRGFYGLPTVNNISFATSDIDVVQFISAGFLDGNSQKPMYYVRRKRDGKYLSYGMGGAQYTTLLTSTGPNYQKWVISKIGTETYNFILPNYDIYGNCVFLRTYLNNGYYNLGFGLSNTIEDLRIFMKESAVATDMNTN